MTYGFIRTVEGEFFDELLVTIKQELGEVRFLEIGVWGGPTVRGIAARCAEIGCPVSAAGVDIKPGDFEYPACDYVYHQGDSTDMWRKITGTYTLLFVDACHCSNHCALDFLNFSPFVVVGGYAVFHDSALPDGADKQDEHPQDHSHTGQPPSVLGVRDALKKLGLLQGHRKDWVFVREIPSSDGTCGMMLYKKVAAL